MMIEIGGKLFKCDAIEAVLPLREEARVLVFVAGGASFTVDASYASVKAALTDG